MKLFWPILLSSICIHANASDFGDGTDGDCTVSGAGGTTPITTAKTTYQCTSLTIDANLTAFNGATRPPGVTAPLIIKVQNDVTFSAGTLVDLSGADGIPGDIVAEKDGGLGGAGGSAGGNSRFANHGLDGVGAGKGIAGKYIPVLNSYGGGGGGGAYGTRIATEPNVGLDAITPGSATELASAGTNGTVPPGINEANFESIFTGGFGGAAGGAGDNNGTPVSGSSGGGGGGAIRIIAGGNISVDGEIRVNGGNGGGGGAIPFAGGGGAGSGGAIWLQSAENLTINGILSVAGGALGIGDISPTSDGGAGGLGRIRLDDGDGVIAGTVPPIAYTSKFVPTVVIEPITVRQYNSSVSCARVALDSKQSFLINLLLGMGIALGFGLIGKRKVRS